MDEHAKIPRALVDELFELGVMGIEIPEALRRRRRHASFTPCWPSRSCRASIRRSACWSTSRTRSSSTRCCVGAARTSSGAGCPRWRRARSARTRSRRPGPAATPSRSPRAPTEDGDAYVLTGRKLWITNGNEANLFIVFATVNPEAGYRGITAFLVERGVAGFSVGKKEDKLGIRASSTCELIFEECRVPKAQVLGEVGKGYKTAIETLNEGRIGIGAQMIGLARGALEHAITLHEGAQAVRQGDRRLPGRAVPDCARGDGDRGRDADRLQRRAAARRAAGRS